LEEKATLRFFKRAGVYFDKLLLVLTSVACVILAFMWLSINFEVIVRYFLHCPQGWPLEVAGYSMLYICFLSAAWLLSEDGHVRMDAVLHRLNPKNQALLNTITAVLGAIIFLVLTWYTAKETWEVFQRGVEVSMSYLETPKGTVLVMIPVGSFLLFIQFLRMAHRYRRKWQTPAEMAELRDIKGGKTWNGR